MSKLQRKKPGPRPRDPETLLNGDDYNVTFSKAASEKVNALGVAFGLLGSSTVRALAELGLETYFAAAKAGNPPNLVALANRYKQIGKSEKQPAIAADAEPIAE